MCVCVYVYVYWFDMIGRVVVGTLGGGLKHPYLWVDYKRNVPPGSPPLVERVSVFKMNI